MGMRIAAEPPVFANEHGLFELDALATASAPM
jgi:hypothetical protein